MPTSSPAPWLLAAVLAGALADPASAQRGGGRNRRPQEIQDRVACRAVDVAFTAPEGEPTPDLAATDFVRSATAAKHCAVLYLFDGSAEEETRQQFERTLFGSDETGLYLRCFQFGRIDLQRAEDLQARYRKQAPLFVVFDKSGKQVGEIAMPGWKANASALIKGLEKAGNSAFKPSLKSFVDRMGDLVRDMEQLHGKRTLLEQRIARAGDADKQKQAELQRDLDAIAAELQQVEKKEGELLLEHNVPTQPEGAVRLGGRDRGDWGGRGGAGSGSGAGGGGAGGGGRPGAGGGGRGGRSGG